MGLRITDGADAATVNGLITAAADSGASVSATALMPAHQKIEGAPSVLYDAVAIAASAEGGRLLAKDKTAQDFVSDAWAHCKLIAYTREAAPLFEDAGVPAGEASPGLTALSTGADAADFIQACGALRVWSRDLEADRDT